MKNINIFFDYKLSTNEQVKNTQKLFYLWKTVLRFQQTKLILFGYPMSIFIFRLMTYLYAMDIKNSIFLTLSFIRNIIFKNRYLHKSIVPKVKSKYTLQIGKEKIPKKLSLNILTIKEFKKTCRKTLVSNPEINKNVIFDQMNKNSIILYKHNGWVLELNNKNITSIKVIIGNEEITLTKQNKTIKNCFTIWDDNSVTIMVVTRKTSIDVPHINGIIMKKCKLFYSKDCENNFIYKNDNYIIWNNYIFHQLDENNC